MAVKSLEREGKPGGRYIHAEWELRRRFLRFLIRVIGTNLLAKIDKIEGLENVPTDGPAILMINHIAFIDPLVVIHAVPRNIVPLAKFEVYNYPLIGIFPRLWGVIPVRREGFDRHAVQQIMDVLASGEIVLVAPEGTRSPDGQLMRAKEGVAYLASRSAVPIIPVAIDGTIGFPALPFSHPWRAPGVCIRFGKPFRFRSLSQRANRDVLRKMTDEAMYILAALLPDKRRGFYADLSKASQDTIEWV